MKDEVGFRVQGSGVSTRKRKSACPHPTERRNETQVRCGRCGAFLRRFIALFICLSLNFSVLSCADASLDDCLDAVCRVSHSDGDGTRSVGSGCAFEIAHAGEPDAEVRVLTNWHVAEGRDDLTVEFWRAGHQSVQFRGVCRWGSYNPRTHRDIAVVGVPLADFAGLPPAVIPLADPAAWPRPGDTVLSAGCELGRWPSAWRGHVVDQADAAAVRFLPISVEGRSGSPLFDADGKTIVGLIAWHDGQLGIAMTVQEIHRAFRGETGPVATVRSKAQGEPLTETQLLGPWKPSPRCPGGICPLPRPTPAPQPKPATPYPTLPSAAPPIAAVPAAPPAVKGCDCPPNHATQSDLSAAQAATDQKFKQHAAATDQKLADQSSATESKLDKLAAGIKSAIEKAQSTPAGQAAEKVAGQAAGSAIDAAAGAGTAALLKTALATGGPPAVAIVGIGLLLMRRLKPSAPKSSAATPESLAAAVTAALAKHSAAAGGAAPPNTFHGRATPTAESDGNDTAAPKPNAIARSPRRAAD